MGIRNFLPRFLTDVVWPRRNEASAAANAPAYKAFISYSHAADGKLAPAIQAGLHRFAKPWYRLRAMRVFRDETTLATSPELWPSIETALEQSEYFLFLASPEAAQSYWVRREFEYWVQKRSKDRMLIILTDGELIWDRDTGDFDWTRTTAVPREINHGFRDEPLYLDLRWAKTAAHLSIRDLTFRSSVADVASTLLQRPKDELIGEDVRRHRQTRRITWSAIIALVLLTALSIFAAITAVQNEREARRQQQIAEDRQHLSQSRQLAAQSLNELQAGRLDLALLLGLEGMHPIKKIRDRDPAQSFNARQALMQALQTNPHLQTYLYRADRNIGGISFSPGGELLAVATSTIITFWDPFTLKQSGTALEGPGDAVFKIAFNPDASVLAVGSRGKKRLLLFDVLHRKPLHPPLSLQQGAIAGLAFSPDSKFLASGAGDDTIVLWNVASGKPDGQALKGHTSNVVSLAFSPDGRLLASGSWDTKAIVWNRDTRQPFFPAIKHRGQVEAVAFSPDGSVLATASGSVITFWDPKNGMPFGKSVKHSGKVNAIVFNPDGKVLAAAGSGSQKITLWDLADRKRLSPVLNGHSGGITSLSFSGDSRTLASGSVDYSVILWQLNESLRLGQAETGDSSGASSLALSSDGRIMAVGGCGSRKGGGCKQGVIRLWSVTKHHSESPPVLKTHEPLLTGPKQAVQTIVFGPEDQKLISGSCARYNGSRCVGVEIRYWDLEKGELGDPITLLEGVHIEAMRLGAEGRILATATPVKKRWQTNRISHYEVWLTDTATGKPIGEPLTGHSNLVHDIRFDPHSKRLAAVGVNQKIIIWDIATGLQLFEPLSGHRVVFSRDGNTIVTFKTDSVSNIPMTIILWDAATGEKIRQTVTPWRESIVSAAVISHDGQMLAFSDTDRQIILWDLNTDQQLARLPTARARVVGLAFTTDNMALMSVDAKGALVVWDLMWNSWRERACRIANRNLSYNEWIQYVGDDPYRLTCPDLGVPSSVVDAGRNLAAAGDIEGGTAILAHAVELGDNRVQDPQAEAKTIAVDGFVQKATRLATAGNVESAEALFEKAVHLKPDLKLNPTSEARKLAAPLLVSKGMRLARLGQVPQALETYALAQVYDASVEIKPTNWDALCMSGLLNGQASKVLPACNQAVERSTDWNNYYDSRGLARALAGDTSGAIEDFQAFIPLEKEPTRRAGRTGSVQEQAQLDYIARVQGWIDALRAGQDPFTVEELEQLRRIRFK